VNTRDLRTFKVIRETVSAAEWQTSANEGVADERISVGRRYCKDEGGGGIRLFLVGSR